MRPMQFCIFKEEPYYVAQCLNVDVASFGESAEEAIRNLKEAVELHFDGAETDDYRHVEDVRLGEATINA